MFLTCFTKSVENQFLHIRNLVCRQDSFALGKFCGSGLSHPHRARAEAEVAATRPNPWLGVNKMWSNASTRGPDGSVWACPAFLLWIGGYGRMNIQNSQRCSRANIAEVSEVSTERHGLILYYTYGYIWWFPKIGAPPNHPFLDWIFQYKSSSYWGSPMTMETSIYTTTIKFTAGDLDRLS